MKVNRLAKDNSGAVKLPGKTIDGDDLKPSTTCDSSSAGKSEAGSASEGGSGTGTVNPKDVRYMQSSIKNQTGGYTVLENAQALKESTLKPSDLPEIRIWKDNDGN